MFTPIQISAILNQPPYEPPQGQLPSTPIKMRIADVANVSISPFKNADLEKYGMGELSKRVIKHKLEEDLTVGRNASLVIFESPSSANIRYTIGHTSGPPGGPHGELKALDKLPRKIDKKKILAVYTERKCCPNCHAKLKKYLNPKTKVVHSCHYTPSKRQRVIEGVFREVQSQAGIRVPGKKNIRAVLFPSS